MNFPTFFMFFHVLEKKWVKIGKGVEKEVFLRYQACGQIKCFEVEIVSLSQIKINYGGVIPVLGTTLKNLTQSVNLKEDQSKVKSMFKDNNPGFKILIQKKHFVFWSNLEQKFFFNRKPATSIFLKAEKNRA